MEGLSEGEREGLFDTEIDGETEGLTETEIEELTDGEIDEERLPEIELDTLGEILADNEELTEELNEAETEGEIEGERLEETTVGPTQFPFWSITCVLTPEFITQNPLPEDTCSNFVAIRFYLTI